MKRLGIFLGGIILGVGLALLVGWVLFPVIRYNDTPASMRKDYRDEYVRLTALAYQVDRNLALAEDRLQALSDGSPSEPLVALILQWIDEERSVALIAPLAALARDMGVDTAYMKPYLD
ncbi:MAG: hypothetical protein P1S60_00160 [Anaerolineae bacterium]|nr:hypothetical protein [Anaerolineae bacterium]